MPHMTWIFSFPHSKKKSILKRFLLCGIWIFLACELLKEREFTACLFVYEYVTSQSWFSSSVYNFWCFCSVKCSGFQSMEVPKNPFFQPSIQEMPRSHALNEFSSYFPKAIQSLRAGSNMVRLWRHDKSHHIFVEYPGAQLDNMWLTSLGFWQQTRWALWLVMGVEMRVCGGWGWHEKWPCERWSWHG